MRHSDQAADDRCRFQIKTVRNHVKDSRAWKQEHGNYTSKNAASESHHRLAA